MMGQSLVGFLHSLPLNCVGPLHIWGDDRHDQVGVEIIASWIGSPFWPSSWVLPPLLFHPPQLPFLSTPMPDPNLSRAAAKAVNVVISRLQMSCRRVMVFVRNSVLLMSVQDISIVKKDIIMNRGGMHFCLYAKNRNFGVHFPIVDDVPSTDDPYLANKIEISLLYWKGMHYSK